MSTISLNDVRTKPCLRKAGAINYHVYLRSAGSIHPDLRDWYNEVPQTWQEPEVIDATENGFYCEFYKPKGDPGSPGYCPPVLAFRGSETQASDFAKLGLAIRFNFTFASNVRGSGVLRMLNAANNTLNWWTNGGVIVPAHGAGQGASHEQVMSWLQQLPNQRDVASLNGSVDVSFRRENMTPFNDDMIDETITVNYTLSVKLHFDHNGDWGTNITQGMGEPTEQYDLAAQEGEKRAKEAIDDWNGKLIITGHSLGGGLAATAAISGKFHHSDCDITCVTYNAAGVHAQTVLRDVNRTASLGENPSTTNFAVQDEILNTMQDHQSELPLVTPIIRWANALPTAPETPMGFSSARNTTMWQNGISPGSTGMGTFAPEYAPLPVLWPLKDNTMAEAQLQLTEDERFQELTRSTEARQAEVLGPIDERLADMRQERADMWTLTESQRERAAALDAQIEALQADRDRQAHELYDLRVPTYPNLENTGNFPILTGLHEMAVGCQNGDQFVRGLIGYFLTGEMDAHRGGGFSLDSDVATQATTRVQRVITEGQGVAPVGIGSVMYHTFDPCAFTFHTPRR